MTPKQYLNQIRLLDIRIDQRKEQLNELKASALGRGIDYSSDRVQSSGMHGATDAVERWTDLEIKINKMIRKYVTLKNKIIGQIQQMDDPRYVEILYRRYVGYETFLQISGDMHFDYKYICRLHGDALRQFDKQFLHKGNTNNHE